MAVPSRSFKSSWPTHTAGEFAPPFPADYWMPYPSASGSRPRPYPRRLPLSKIMPALSSWVAKWANPWRYR